MKVKIYKITVYTSMLDVAHGEGRPLFEVYIPELGIFINKTGAFSAENKEIEKRYVGREFIKDVEIDNPDAVAMLASLADNIKFHDKLVKAAQELFTDELMADEIGE
jgi:hypothetical protein